MTQANSAAFPHEANLVHNGLTKRELFAAMAMQGILANEGGGDNTARYAVYLADALIAALNEPTK